VNGGRDAHPATSIEQTGRLESALDADFVRIRRQLRRELNGARAQHALADDVVGPKQTLFRRREPCAHHGAGEIVIDHREKVAHSVKAGSA